MTWGTLKSVAEAVDLMQVSWSDNQDRRLDYTVELLENYLRAPGPIQHLSPAVPAIYEDNSLAGFVAVLPRRLAIEGREANLALLTFFTIASKWKGRGLGRALWAESLRQAQLAGYDGAIHFCAEGNKSNFVTVAAAESLGLTATEFMRVNFMMRAMTSEAVKGHPPATRSTVDFMSAAAREVPSTRLVRLWTEPEADWHCCGREGALCVTNGRGAIAGYRARVLDGLGTRCVFIDDVLWRDMSEESRGELLNSFLTAAAHEAEIAVVPVLNYADMSMFTAARFRRSPKCLRAYLTMFRGDPPVDPSSLYIDIV